jgi:hypothetical protein
VSWKNAITKTQVVNMPLQLFDTSIYAILFNTKPYTPFIQPYIHLYGHFLPVPSISWSIAVITHLIPRTSSSEAGGRALAEDGAAGGRSQLLLD